MNPFVQVIALAVALLVGQGLAPAAPGVGYVAAGVLLLVGLVMAWWRQPTPPAAPPRRRRDPSPSSLSLVTSPQLLKLLESAVVHAHDAVVILEAQPKSGPGRAVLYVNDAFCRLTGYTRDEVLGRSLHFLRGPNSDENALGAIRDAFASGSALRVELQNYRKDGRPFWVDLSLVPVPDATGTAAHWVMIQRDITERKAGEEERRQREALLRSIFESTAAGIVLIDGNGRFVSCNPAFAAMTGRSVQDILKLTPFDLTHPDDHAELMSHLEKVRTGQSDRFSCSKRYVRPDGEIVWSECTFAAVRGPGGELECGVGVSLNVTERRKLEEQLRHVQKMEVLGQMAGGIAHDFNNLFTAILGNLSQIHLPEGDPNRVHLETIEQATARAADLTGKLLGYARKHQLVPGPVYPADIFAEVAGLIRPALDPRIRLVVNPADDCEPVQADPTLLTQVLLNLCLNARDAMPHGGTLTLSAENVEITEEQTAHRPGEEAYPGRFVKLTVADTGCGMTEDVQARLFEPFFTTKEVGKGTGLGLPMAQGIVKQHHGWITFRSTPGAGTVFDVYLPRAVVGGPHENCCTADRPVRSNQPDQPDESERSGRSSRSDRSDRSDRPDGSDRSDGSGLAPSTVTDPGPVDGGRPEKPSILLVDDEAMIVQIGRLTLERAGFEVVTAGDGAEAVEVFRDRGGRFDLVILDVTMPVMSGRDAFRQLVELDPGVKVLFSTGFTSEDLIELDGAVGLLTKPYRPQNLLAAVRSALGEEVTTRCQPR